MNIGDQEGTYEIYAAYADAPIIDHVNNLNQNL